MRLLMRGGGSAVIKQRRCGSLMAQIMLTAVVTLSMLWIIYYRQ